ncbi:DNA polymerase III subunit gamma and tau [Bailinhaonella thermotolerans]|uniref:DNA-directed DNA polymerase n=1 Tax=Bailinhaonella thermotolerans TaxID=1070861 RepID=A0A3A4AXF0_9ACTN|nr:DNA polymerase III subunit gamma and tau [Bailinhaonella thermotolerans]RJL32074.1 DNA polymerase III subunit gamma and tau [Bailinhaonella thermotolerans]
MSLALYRKYRPGTFAEVKGQEHVTEPLRQALRAGRIHHAYLFSGPRGCGKTSSARILARSLNCEQGPTPDPCGECDSCVALAPTGPGHIDVIEIDAASHGGVDDARDLRERAFFAPVSARYKVYIIDEAHMVTREGFNALLKLVEEPPPHLKFVFATTEPEKVIGTIKSRTHHYPFRLMPPGTLRQLMEEILASESVPFEPAALPLVVRAGAGSARDSLSILDQLLAGATDEGITYAGAVSLLGYTDAGLLDEMIDAFAARDGAALFQGIDRVMEGGHDPRRFAADLLERFRDLVILANVPDAPEKGLLDRPADEIERMRGQVGKLGPAELTRAAEVFNAGLTEMRGATSPRLLLELICARVLLPGATADEASLLTRLERLERGVPAADAVRPAPASPEPARQAVPHVPPPGMSDDQPGGSGLAAARAAARAAASRPAPSPAPASPAPASPAPAGRAPAATAPRPEGPASAAGTATAPGTGTATAPGASGDDDWGPVTRPGAGGPAGTGSPAPASATSGEDDWGPVTRPGTAGSTPADAPPAGAPSADAPSAASPSAPAPAAPGVPDVEIAEPGVPAVQGGGTGPAREPVPAKAGVAAAGAAEADDDWGPVVRPGTAQAASAAPAGPAADPTMTSGAPPAGGDGGSGPAASRPAPAPAAGPAQPDPGASGAGQAGRPDLATIRQSWPSIVEAIKGRSRVAWASLSNGVQVAGVDGNAVTLAFAQQGDMRGFTLGHRDLVVAEVLKERFGGEWRVEAVLGGPGGGTSAPPPSGGPRPGAPQGPEQPRPRPDTPAPGAPAGSEPQRQADSGRTRAMAMAAAAAAAAEREPEPEHNVDDVDPLNDLDADGEGSELTGVALIQRELGAQIIGVIDHA